MTFFEGLRCLVIPNVLGKSRADLFVRKLKEFGGIGDIYSSKRKTDSLTAYSHLVVDASLTYSQVEKILGN